MSFITRYFILPNLHALFFITLSIVAGISCSFVAVPLLLQITIAIISLGIGLAFRMYFNCWQFLFFYFPLAFLVGSLLCTTQQNIQKDFQKFTQNKTFNLWGTISTIENIQNPRFNYRMIVDLDKIAPATQHAEFFSRSESIAFYTQRHPACLVGDYVTIDSVTFKKITNMSFGNYLAKEKIAATIFIEKPNITVLKRPFFSLNRFIFNLRQKILTSLRKKINPETFQLFSSVFLGNRTIVKKQMDHTKEPFKIWGVSHYLARSGLHLVIFVIVWHFILSLAPIPFLLRQIVLLLLILMYALLSWSSISFERALLMVLVSKFCLLNNRPSHYIHIIILVTLIVLCSNPLQLFFLDFQLSFGLTLALAWFNHLEAHKKRVLSQKYCET